MIRPLPLFLASLLPVAAPAEPVPARPATSAALVSAANRSALREPTTQWFVKATQVYPYAEGALYRLFTAPERVSDIALQPGETLVSVAAGDTARWTVGDTASGSGAAKRTHVLIKPFAAGLRTNLVIATDRRVYHLQLESRPAAAMAAIAWTYPEDALLALKRSPPPADQAPDLAVEAWRFDYRITGDRPRWRPVRAFDDGRQTFIEFPTAIGQGEAPPLFLVGRRGQLELVNYRMRGRFYVVDRLFDAAELRLGAKPQQVVRITRQSDEARRREPGRP